MWATETKLAKAVIDAFEQHAIVGSILVEGLTDQELEEMGISSKILRRTTLANIKLLLDKGKIFFRISFLKRKKN